MTCLVSRPVALASLFLALSGAANGADEVGQALKSARLAFAQFQMATGAGWDVRKMELYRKNLAGMIAEANRDIDSLQVEINAFNLPRAGRNYGRNSESDELIRWKEARKRDLNELKRERDRVNGALPDGTDRKAIAQAKGESQRSVEERFGLLRDAAAGQSGDGNIEQVVREKMRAAGWKSGTEDALGSPDDFLAAFRQYATDHPAGRPRQAASGDSPKAVRPASAAKGTGLDVDSVWKGPRKMSYSESPNKPADEWDLELTVTSKDGEYFTGTFVFSYKGNEITRGSIDGIVKGDDVFFSEKSAGRYGMFCAGRIAGPSIRYHAMGTGTGGSRREGDGTLARQ